MLAEALHYNGNAVDIVTFDHLDNSVRWLLLILSEQVFGGAWWAAVYGVAHDWSNLAAAGAAEQVLETL